MTSLKIFVALFWASSAMAYRCTIRDVTITCLDVKGQEMIEMLNEIREDKIYRNGRVLELEDFKCLLSLPMPWYFRNMRFNVLALKNGNLPYFQPPCSRGEVKTRIDFSVLELDSLTGLKNWNWEHVTRYANIKRLRVRNSLWRHIPSEISEFYRNRVEEIVINNCHVRWLDNDSLYCPSCQIISLENNEIQELRKEVFGNGLRKLQELNLSKNKIQSFPPDLFDNFDNLKQEFTLTLSDNPITVLDEASFKNLPKTIILISEKESPVFECSQEYYWLCDDAKYETRSFYCLLPSFSQSYSIPKYFENIVGKVCPA